MTQIYLKTSDSSKVVEVTRDGARVVDILKDTRFDSSSIEFAALTNTLKPSAMTLAREAAKSHGLRLAEVKRMFV